MKPVMFSFKSIQLLFKLNHFLYNVSLNHQSTIKPNVYPLLARLYIQNDFSCLYLCIFDFFEVLEHEEGAFGAVVGLFGMLNQYKHVQHEYMFQLKFGIKIYQVSSKS